MNLRGLIARSLVYYWRTNAAVVAGVGVAVAVLAGALLVGDSVRGSLREIVLQRLGRTDYAVLSPSFFRTQLAEDTQRSPDFMSAFDAVTPLVLTQGVVSIQAKDGRAANVLVYGVDDRFWSFHRMTDTALRDREAFLSPALAAELGAEAGDTVLVRVQRPSDIPLESLFSFKTEPARAVRTTLKAVLPREALGEFSLRAQQGAVHAVFLPLELLQEEMAIGDRSNVLLVGARDSAPAGGRDRLAQLVRNQAQLEDLGLRLRLLDSTRSLVVEGEGGLLSDDVVTRIEEVATKLTLRPQRVLTYLANRMVLGGKEIPYSLVTAIDLPVITATDVPAIVLNTWAARELGARNGDTLTMEYYVWEDPGQLVTRTAHFRVAGTVLISGGDREFTPPYPGITDAAALTDWDPPFPIDLRRVRPVDEEYWDRYGPTPKAFITLDTGRSLWGSRHGSTSSVRLTPISPTRPIEQIQDHFTQLLRVDLASAPSALSVAAVRADSLEASQGATNFGEYFVYFSFFLVVSALLLAVLFFKLSVEQRIQEVGLLRAVGLGPGVVREIFLGEGMVLAFLGAVAGILGAIGYAWIIVTALRTWWVDAVGTTAISLHLNPVSLLAGALGGMLAAMICIALTLRSLGAVSERSLLSGQLTPLEFAVSTDRRSLRSSLGAAIVLAAACVVLMLAGARGTLSPAAAFFGAGAALLASALLFVHYRLGVRRPAPAMAWRSVRKLGFRNASFRPTRTVVAMATIAAAIFILIAVDSFRKPTSDSAAELPPGTGGYSLALQTTSPLVHDPNADEGREQLLLPDLGSATIEPFRVRPGDDASCLNLYAPTNPRIMAPSDRLVMAGRFAFKDSLASTPEEEANPWLLLKEQLPDGAIPVIADANSMTYVLHRKLGEEITVPAGTGEIRLKLVAALADSIFQGELLMSEANFVKVFPEIEGYRFMLVEADPLAAADVAVELENALSDYGADAFLTADRLAEFHRVENTYLSTFQMLGGLGLLLGTAGLAAVMLRNVLERRRELALLRALGYRRKHFLVMALTESALILAGGLLIGVVCAAIAIAPVVADRGGRLPGPVLALLVAAILAVGLLTSVIATASALRPALLASLKSE